MRICVVGGGISSHGFLLGVLNKLINTTNERESLVIDIYCKGIKVDFHHNKDKLSLPNSDSVGYLKRWGATFSLAHDGTKGFDYLLNLLGLKPENFPKLFDGAKEYSWQNTPYISYSRDLFNCILLNKIDQLGTLAKINYLNKYVDRIEIFKSCVFVNTSNSIEKYDHVVLCSGAIGTAALLFSSGLIRSSELKVLDHGIDFDFEKYEFSESNYFYPGMSDIQEVSSKQYEGTITHCSSLKRKTFLTNKGLAEIYEHLAGRRSHELMLENPVKLSKKVFKEGLRISTSIPRVRHIKAAITCDKSCDVVLGLSKNTPPIIKWKSNLKTDLVSAFHFHGSLLDCKKELIGLENRLTVADMSLSKSVYDRNIGSNSFSIGFNSALKFFSS